MLFCMTAIQDMKREIALYAAAMKQTERFNTFNDKQQSSNNNKLKTSGGNGCKKSEAASLNQKSASLLKTQVHQGCQPQQVEPKHVSALHPRPQQCIGVWCTKYQIIQPTHPSLHSSILVVSMNSFWIAAGNHQLTMYPEPLFSLAAMTKHAS